MKQYENIRVRLIWGVAYTVDHLSENRSTYREVHTHTPSDRIVAVALTKRVHYIHIYV